MTLIERDAAFGALRELVDAARTQGRMVFVAGEVGSGKTVLVREAVARLPAGVRCMQGFCDSLRTARPFGPIAELARDHAPALAATIAAGASRDHIFDSVFELLRGEPCVVVVEDVHWADDATLDLLRFLGRRMARTRALAVVTYRGDEVVPGHPCYAVLGELATTSPARIDVAPLSVEGVVMLAAAHGVDGAELHRRTGGNAFFVTECLSARSAEVPTTVREAVLARAASLGPRARETLDTVAIVPGRVELWLIERLGVGAGIDECIAAGMLVSDGSVVTFRHELARVAILGAVLPGRRRELHRRVIAQLEEPLHGRVDHARIIHHADAADDVARVVLHGPAAATVAAAAGARREAVAHLELTMRHAGHLERGRGLALGAQLAEQLATIGRHVDAIASYEKALAIATAPVERGELLARMWHPLTMSGQIERARRVVEEAIALLEPLPPSPALALAYAQRCSQHMLARELADAEPWGKRAIEAATALGATDVLAYALVQSGVALWMAGSDDGLDRLEHGVDLARTHDLAGLVAQGLSQIGSGGGEVRRYHEAVPALQQCIVFSERCELGSRGLYAMAWLGRCELELGRWDSAQQVFDRVMRSPLCEGITRMTAVTALGKLRSRRGAPDPWGPLDEARALVRDTQHLQRTWPVAVARAEAAWQDGRLDAELGLVAEVYRDALRLGYPWAVGELAFWLWRGGKLAEPPPGAAEPFALHMRGRHADAAAAWAAIGCPYERACALADDPASHGEARAIFEQLGAVPAARRLGHRAAVSRVVPRAVDVDDVPEFILDSEVWTVRFGSSTIRLKDSRGIQLLAAIVAQPDREQHVLDLVGASETDLGDAGDALDAEAIRAYRQRIADLRERQEEAEQAGKYALAEAAHDELEAITRELARGVGLGNRARRVGAATERARVNVQKRVRDAMRRIESVAPELGRYLGWTVRTGTFCVFRPGSVPPMG